MDEPNRFFQFIKHEYKHNSCLERFINPDQALSIGQGYINLALVENKEIQVEECILQNIQQTSSVMNTFEQIYNTKTPIDVKFIFEKCKNKSKKLLVLGRAGIGKSTFCRYAAYRWANGEIWPQYDLVIVVPLRRLTAEFYPSVIEYSPVDIVIKLYLSCTSLSQEDKQILREQLTRSKVLWILDGYDEVAASLPTNLEKLMKYFQDDTDHILTSRPYAVSLSYDVQMEVIGFTDDNIAKYINQFFHEIKVDSINTSSTGQDLERFLKSNPSIYGVAHIPINLELICSLWSDRNSSETTAITTTELFDNMIQWFCKRYLKKQKNFTTETINALSKNEIYECCEKELIFLETLAFHGMTNNKFILQSELMESALMESNFSGAERLEIPDIGILKLIDNKTTVAEEETKKEYYFVHLSFQEYFTARYLVNALKNSENSRLRVIEFIKEQKYNQRFICVFTFTSGLLHQLNDLTREITNAHPTLIESLTTQTMDTDSSIRNNSWKALGNMREQACTNRILSQSPKALHDNDWRVRQSAGEALVKMGNKEVTDEVIGYIIIAVEAGDPHIRSNAKELFPKFARETTTGKLPQSFINVFHDEKAFNRICPWKAIKQISEKLSTSALVEILIIGITDRLSYISDVAYQNLIDRAEKTKDHEMITQLISAIQNSDAYVRQAVCDILVKIGAKVATSEVINKLIDTLDNADPMIRKTACQLLGTMGEKLATDQSISKIIDALDNLDPMVRKTA
ncbi:unnamed protein product [Rotaria magnacalcarata]|uniref:NACHT domain-containing protein n=3 Tax=Rotaria magnacalcarata TaxID=392030 RepID=A0A814XB94_9BILA|nr:unnamed protein product [Rotaria magnacalcarata]